MVLEEIQGQMQEVLDLKNGLDSQVGHLDRFVSSHHCSSLMVSCRIDGLVTGAFELTLGIEPDPVLQTGLGDTQYLGRH